MSNKTRCLAYDRLARAHAIDEHYREGRGKRFTVVLLAVIDGEQNALAAADTFDEAAMIAGGSILTDNPREPEAIYDLETCERIEIRVEDPLVRRLDAIEHEPANDDPLPNTRRVALEMAVKLGGDLLRWAGLVAEDGAPIALGEDIERFAHVLPESSIPEACREIAFGARLVRPGLEDKSREPLKTMTTCDTCGDMSNSAPGLRCGRVDNEGDEPCTGTYREPTC